MRYVFVKIKIITVTNTHEIPEGEDKRHGPAGWWYEQFKIADADYNGLLDFDELKE